MVVIDRHEPGQPHPRLISAIQVKIPRCLRDSVGCRPARFERAEIEHRFDRDEAPQLARLRRLSAGEDTPGKSSGPAGKCFFGGVGCHGHRPSQTVELELPELHPLQAKRQRTQGPPEALIRDQGSDQGIGRDQTLCQPRHLVGRQIEQSISLKKAADLRLVHGANEIFACRESRGQLGRGLLDELGGGRVDYDKYIRLRESLHVLECPLRPRQIGREEIRNIGLDREIAHRVGG